MMRYFWQILFTHFFRRYFSASCELRRLFWAMCMYNTVSQNPHIRVFTPKNTYKIRISSHISGCTTKYLSNTFFEALVVGGVPSPFSKTHWCQVLSEHWCNIFKSNAVISNDVLTIFEKKSTLKGKEEILLLIWLLFQISWRTLLILR